ncbi:MAG: dihydropteroate synthase [Gammaproteobacteria bacterium]|nr:dihydropteroate synthase [Gammaproteobacteria bacterium]
MSTPFSCLPARPRWQQQLRQVLPLGEGAAPSGPLVMGILNITPDSFYDGGAYVRPQRALHHARHLLAAGADIIDIGGESSRPGAASISESEEFDRVIPTIEALRNESDTMISLDTSRSRVMRAGLAAGADLINDIRAFAQAPDVLTELCQRGVPVCVVHMQGEPASMQHDPRYVNVVADVFDFLEERARHCIGQGLSPNKIVLDPGIGFGKSLAHNLALLHALPALVARGFPVLAGVSRKSMLGTLTGRTVEQRLHGSVAAALHAAQAGAAIVRVHDVAPTIDALKVWQAIAMQPARH